MNNLHTNDVWERNSVDTVRGLLNSDIVLQIINL